jgi:protein O-mannosyl-transferase
MAKNKQFKQEKKSNPFGNHQTSVVAKNIPNNNFLEEKTSGSFLQNSWAVLCILSAAIFVSYFPVWQNEFVWDDKPYILLNDSVKDLSAKGIAHLFSYFEQGNYHPLTMLSLAIEYALVKENTWLYHFDNLIFHIANSYLVFKILQKLTINNLVAFITAVLFAIHPMHVESVAWAAERKDMLYVLFLLLSFLYYLKFDEKQKNSFYILSLVFFLLSCLSKGMAVVLPALLLITDYCFLRKPLTVKLLYNKIPYFLLTIVFAYIATIAQKSAGADASAALARNYFGIERLLLVAYAFCFYWVNAILPYGLLAFHPYPAKVNNGLPTEYYLAFAGVILIVGSIYWLGKKDRRIWWGGAFFLISVSTVLQIFPVGSAIAADRYFYLSSIGILFLIALIINGLAQKFSPTLIIVSIIGLGLCILTFRQTTLWKNQLTLFTPILEKFPNDAMTISNIGWYYVDKKDFPEGKKYLLKAIENGLDNQDVNRTVGSMFLDEGDAKTAMKYYENALKHPPVEDRTYWLAALAAAKAGNFEQSQGYFGKITSTKAITPGEFTMMGSNYGATGHFEEARTMLKKAIEKDPDFIDAHLNYAYTFRQEKNLPEEIRLLEELLKKAPNYLPAYKNIGVSLVELGQWQKATEFWQKAATIEQNGSYEYNIGIAYATHGDINTAKDWYLKSAKKGDTNAKSILEKNGVKF